MLYDVLRMPVLRTRGGCGAALLLLYGCASQAIYDPEPKFARFEAAAEKSALTGSRIASNESPVEQSLGALSPTSVLTPDDIARAGQTNLQDFLHRQFPNMVSGTSFNMNRYEPVIVLPRGARPAD
ncbi:hypothetical protein BH24PSE2_BH24PSE2_04160 [soil metagenome]